MLFSHWLAAAALAMAPLAASAGQAAQQATQQADPADPDARVPASGYASAFSGYLSAPEEQAPPDTVWRAANDEMGRLKGHAGHIKDDAVSPPAAENATPADHGTDHGHHH